MASRYVKTYRYTVTRHVAIIIMNTDLPSDDENSDTDIDEDGIEELNKLELTAVSSSVSVFSVAPVFHVLIHL